MFCSIGHTARVFWRLRQGAILLPCPELSRAGVLSHSRQPANNCSVCAGWCFLAWWLQGKDELSCQAYWLHTSSLAVTSQYGLVVSAQGSEASGLGHKSAHVHFLTRKCAQVSLLPPLSLLLLPSSSASFFFLLRLPSFFLPFFPSFLPSFLFFFNSFFFIYFFILLFSFFSSCFFFFSKCNESRMKAE